MTRCPVCKTSTDSDTRVCRRCGWEFRAYLTGMNSGEEKDYRRALEQYRAEWNRPRHGSLWVEPESGIEFIWIKSGSFPRCQWADRQKRTFGPVHEIGVGGFWIGKYPVTRRQWAHVMKKEAPERAVSRFPAANTAWIDAESFIREFNRMTGELAYRLPTEAEWEYVCRCGNSGGFCSGAPESNIGEYAWYAANSGGRPHAVGGKKPNAWGVYDMHGNVQEWCMDWYGPYPAESVNDPAGPVTGSCRVYRGGSYIHEAAHCACDFRNWDKPGVRRPALGFRLAKSPAYVCNNA